VELCLLLERLGRVSLNDNPDERFMWFGTDKSFSIKNCYYALNFGGVS
jgi:hypothetical protein